MVGFINRARANAILILQPPEKSRVFFACICLLKPRPCKISAARFSAVEASRASNPKASASFSNFNLSSSQLITASNADMSEASISLENQVSDLGNMVECPWYRPSCPARRSNTCTHASNNKLQVRLTKVGMSTTF
ncbi:hypothetical protein CR513_17413, partial [Mucuna pruriens]